MARTAVGLLLAFVSIVTSEPVCRANETPGQALVRFGDRTGPSALAVWPNYTAQTKERQTKNPFTYVVVGTNWNGGVEGLKYLKALPGVRGVMFSHPGFGDEWCECLRGMTGLEELYVLGKRFTDVGAAELKDVTKLECLSLTSTKITDAGMENLKRMTRLKRLSLAVSWGVTDKGFAYVPVKELRWLNLDGTSVSGDSMLRLRKATNLEWLRESGQPFIGVNGAVEFREVDAGLRHLKGLKHLKYVSVHDMPVTEGEMKELLAHATELAYVELGDAIFSREGFQPRDRADAVNKALKRIKDQARDAAKH